MVGSRNVSADVASGLRDVHGLFDGGVSTAHLKQATLQSVLADHHSEKHPHLIVPRHRAADGDMRRRSGAGRPTAA